MNGQAKLTSPQEGPVYQVLGDPVRLLLSGQETGGAYFVLELTSTPGNGVPCHVHEREDEVMFVLQGRYAMELNGQEFEVGPGSLVNLPRNLPHGYRCLGPEPGKILVTVMPAALEGMFQDLSGQPPGPEAITRICRSYGIEFQPPLQPVSNELGSPSAILPL